MSWFCIPNSFHQHLCHSVAVFLSEGKQIVARTAVACTHNQLFVLHAECACCTHLQCHGARWRHKPRAHPYNFFPNYSLGTVCFCHQGSLKQRGKAIHIWNSKKTCTFVFPMFKGWCHDACCFPTVHLASWQLEGNAEKIAVMDVFM